MRIAAFPKGYLQEMVVHRTRTVYDWIQEAQLLGVDGLELHTGFLWDTSRGEVSRLSDAVAEAGFAMPMMCASPDFTHPDADQRTREREAHAEHMRITREIGGPGASCRVVSGQAHPGLVKDEAVGWVVEALEELLPLARELDVVLAMENHYKATGWHYPEFAQRPEVFLEILDAVPDRTHFGVQFDPSNAITSGIDPGDLLDAVVDRVVTVQASDRHLAPGAELADLRGADGTIGYAPALQHGVIGAGLNDYDRIFTTLVDAGYDGWVSIEDGVNGHDELKASADYLLAAREEWFGGSRAVRVATRESALLASATGEGR